jgi:predicted house-cleaning noncanonical NTP pyrophosphatase (MazG superfamily)
MTGNTNNILDSSKTFNGGAVGSRRESLSNAEAAGKSSSKQGANCGGVLNLDMRQTQARRQEKRYTLSKPVHVSTRMMERIIKFWRTNAKHLVKDSGFKESEQPKIQKELNYLEEKYMSQLKMLYNLAIQLLSNPESVQQLLNYNMWQSFLTSCQITLNYQRLNAYTIFNSILRGSFAQPHISHFMLSTASLELEAAASSTQTSTGVTPTLRSQSSNPSSGQPEKSRSSGVSKYVVHSPSQFLSFGFYLPLKKMPQLKVFNSAELDQDLRSIAQYYLEDRIKVREHFFYVSLPKFMDWFKQDFQQQQLTYLFEQLDDA